MENRARFSRFSFSIMMLACVLLSSGCETEEEMSPGFEAVHDNDINPPRQLAEEAEEDDRDAGADLQGLLAIGGAIAIGSAKSGGNFSDGQREALVKGFVEDRVNAANGLQTDNLGQTAASVEHQLNIAAMAAEQDRVRAQQGVAGGGRPPAGIAASSTAAQKGTPTPVETPRPTVLALAKPPTAPADESWRVCGVGKKCRIGNLYTETCSGPYVSGPMCTDGCISDSGTFYHDTTLPSNLAYVGGGSKCSRGSCNIVNSCD
jgi:hypothetical protein